MIAVYVLLDSADRVLYVGKTGNVSKRIRQHSAKSWWPDVANIRLLPCSNIDQASFLELELQEIHRPMWATCPSERAAIYRAAWHRRGRKATA